MPFGFPVRSCWKKSRNGFPVSRLMVSAAKTSHLKSAFRASRFALMSLSRGPTVCQSI
jgi:hypothetical protein